MADLRRAAALVAALLTAACTADVSSDTGTGAGPAPGQHAKILRIVGAQELDNLVPLLSNEVDTIDCSMFWAGYFFVLDDKGELVPELATQVPTQANGGISKDGLTIVYHLRRGVTWQDGAPFDARDVRFSWQAVMNPENNVAARTGFDRVRDVRIIDPYTVAFELTTPYAPAVDTFFAPSANPVALLPAHLLARYHDLNRVPYDLKPIGTGPFVIDSWEQGVGVTMHANPHYWRGRPKVDGVRFLTVHDNNTMLLMMRSGEADLYYHAPNGQIPEARAVTSARVVETPFVGYEMLQFNTLHPPLDELIVRRAIAYAIDKQRVVEDVTHGSGIVTASDQPPWLWPYDPHVPQFSARPALARALLASDGWRPGPDGIRVKNGRRLSIAVSTPAGYADGTSFEALFGQWMRDIGVEVEVKNYPINLLYATYGAGGIMATGKFDTAFVDWYNGIDPDDSVQWGCGFVPPQGENFTRWCDPQYDAAERTAMTAYDRATRRAAYGRAQERLAAGLPADPLYFMSRTDIVSDRFVGYRPAPAVSTFWNTWEYDLK